MSRQWETDHTEIVRIREMQSLHSFVVRLKGYTKPQRIAIVLPDTVTDSIIFEKYLDEGNCPLQQGILAGKHEQNRMYQFKKDRINYKIKWKE